MSSPAHVSELGLKPGVWVEYHRGDTLEHCPPSMQREVRMLVDKGLADLAQRRIAHGADSVSAGRFAYLIRLRKKPVEFPVEVFGPNLGVAVPGVGKPVIAAWS